MERNETETVHVQQLSCEHFIVFCTKSGESDNIELSLQVHVYNYKNFSL